MNKFKTGSFIYKNAHFLQLGFNTLGVWGAIHYHHVYEHFIPNNLNKPLAFNSFIVLFASVYTMFSLAKMSDRQSFWYKIADKLIELKSYKSEEVKDNLERIRNTLFYLEDDIRNKLNMNEVARRLNSHLSSWEINYSILKQPISDNLLSSFKNKPYLAMSLLSSNNSVFKFLWEINEQKFNQKDLKWIEKIIRQSDFDKKFVNCLGKGKTFCNLEAIKKFSSPEIFQTLPSIVQDFLLNYTSEENLDSNKKNLLKDLKGEVVSYFSNTDIEKDNKKNIANIHVLLDKIQSIQPEEKKVLLEIFNNIHQKQMSTLEYFTLSNNSVNLEENYFIKNSLSMFFDSIVQELRELFYAQLVTQKPELLEELKNKALASIQVRIEKINQRYEEVEKLLITNIGEKIELKQKSNSKILKIKV